MRGPPSLRSIAKSGRRRCLKLLPLLLLLALALFFQADLLVRSKKYSSLGISGLSRALRQGFTKRNGYFAEESLTSDDADLTRTSACEQWLEENDKVPYSRDFSKHPIIVGYGESSVWETCAIGCEFRGSAALEGPDKADAVFGIRSEPGIESIVRSMESSQYYPEIGLENARRRGYTVVMTTSLASDVPVGYFSWAEYDLMAPPKKKTKTALAAAFISNCGGHNFRLEAITKLREYGVSVDSYGACLRNQDGRVNKLDALRDYKFSLAFENSNEEDYVTEKFWQSLVAGSVPVVVGAPNIHDFAPSSNSILYIKSAGDIEHVAKQMKYLATHENAYNKTLSWKYKGPSDAFKALVDMAVVHSSCRLCLHLGTKLRLEEERKHNRPCQCKHEGQTIYHLYVRERGKFEMESIFMRSNNMTLSSLHDSIISKFTSLNYAPIFKSGRPKVLQGNDALKIYRVYPVGKTQREALYTWSFQSDSDLETFVEENPCANLEVIFV